MWMSIDAVEEIRNYSINTWTSRIRWQAMLRPIYKQILNVHKVGIQHLCNLQHLHITWISESRVKTLQRGKKKSPQLNHAQLLCVCVCVCVSPLVSDACDWYIITTRDAVFTNCHSIACHSLVLQLSQLSLMFLLLVCFWDMQPMGPIHQHNITNTSSYRWLQTLALAIS